MESFLGKQSQELQGELKAKIQSLSNWIDILDRTSLETVYGLLLVSRGQDPVKLWDQLKSDLADLRILSAKLTESQP